VATRRPRPWRARYVAVRMAACAWRTSARRARRSRRFPSPGR
jgi:hypothetical protein